MKERQRRRGGGAHDEKINMQRVWKKGEKKNFDFISKHWFQFSSAFYSNYVSEQLPRAGHKLGFAVAGCLNRQAYSLRLLTWLCGSTLFPILKREQILSFPTVPLSRHVLLKPIWLNVS